MRVHRQAFAICRILCVLLTTDYSLLTPPRGFAQPLAPESGKLTGQKISLDLKGVEIIDVLKLLSQKSGLNFVAGRNVTGRVTIFAQDVDIWEAFERLLDANDLAYERQGALITVMTARDYELLYGQKFQERKRNAVIPLKFAKANQLATVLNQVKSTLGQVVVDEASNTVILNDVPARLQEMQRLVRQLDQPTETKIFSLNYAEAEKLKEKIQEFLTPGIGVFSFDARTNKVVVTDLVDPIRRIEQLIRAFDEQEGEVLIEAKIVKVELTDEQSLGIDWQKLFDQVTDTQERLQARMHFRVLEDIVGGTAKGAALKFSSVEGDTQLVVEALKTYGKVETVSNPRLTVSNNQEAKILVGTKEAFVTTTTTVPATGSTVAAPEVQFVDVGTKLFVTPNVKRDGHIQLKIRPEVSSVKSTVTSISNTVIPIISTTEAETNVLVKSGTTLVIGGLIDTKTDRSRNQVPLLGDIPLLGAAFRSRKDTEKKTELVVFLTPQILSASGQHVTDFSAVQPVERVSWIAQRQIHPVPESYQRLIRDLLAKCLAYHFRATALPAGSVSGSFVLARDGRLVGSVAIRSPQGELMARAAQLAIESIPFPSFPAGSTVSEARFRFKVEYEP